MHANPGCLKQMMDVYDMHGGNIIASEAVPDAELHRYGVLGLASATGNVYRVDSMVEKPAPGRAPSNQIISGRYILQPEIFNILDTVKPGAGGEIQLTDALIEMLARQAFHAVRYEGKTYDCGDRLGFILANLAFGLSRPDLGKDLRQALIRMLSDMDMAGEELPQQSLSHAA